MVFRMFYDLISCFVKKNKAIAKSFFYDQKNVKQIAKGEGYFTKVKKRPKIFN